MKKVSTFLVILFAMMAASVSSTAQEVTVSLTPGWNWISYPNAEAMQVGDALGGFTPIEGDIIQSQFASSKYINGRWRGGVTQFLPGSGYMYYSARSEDAEFVFAQPSSTSVATAMPTGITATSAVAGGMVMLPEGSHVFLRGVCWGTASGPDIDGSHTDEGTGIGSFSGTLEGLNPNTTYYVRAYAVSDHGLAYGNELNFTTIPILTIEATPNPTEGGTITGAGDYEQNAVCTLTAIANEGYVFANWTENGEVVSTDATYTFTVDAARTLVANFDLDHTYVDLGLPSGTLWATCNLGANLPEEYGDYFAWGETQPKDNFSWTNYQYCMGSFNTLTKYCNNPDIGYNGFTDNLTTLEPSDDAAMANWGDDWRMPTEEEWQELYQNTTVTWTTQNGVNGRLFTASNGNSLFMPAAGYRNESTPEGTGIIGDYWTSSLDTDYPSGALSFFFNSSNYYISFCNRLYGRNVRAVRSGSQSTSFVIDAITNPVEGGVVSGGGSYQMGAECTLTATAIDGYAFTNWTENGEEVSINASYTFTVTADRTLVANFVVSSIGDHAYVDLGLPSGTLWATCNVGADNPEDYGDYFAWGETQPKDYYDWSTYQYCNGSISTMTKYCNDASYGYNGFTDDLTSLLPEDDAATVNWGSDWRIPTKEECEELYQNTTHTWTILNGMYGRLFTASNGNSLFLPAAGFCRGYDFCQIGYDGRLWSSSLYAYNPGSAMIFYFFSDGYYMSGSVSRCYGQTIRPVRSSVPTGAIKGKFTINANGDQVYFSQGNLQYQASTNTWKFAENQYDYVGSTNSNISSTYSGWIDLFGWGTSGYNHGANCYQPWSTSTSYSDYYAYGSYSYNLYDQTGQADWGYNPISNGGNQANQWRTLTQPEWAYIFNNRTTSSGIRYARANVNNVNGVILLPDDWSSDTYSLNNTNSSGASFSSNVITASQWSALEQAGAVFLPAAGRCDGTSVISVGSYGGYWSASYRNSYYACGVYFYDSYLNTDYNGSRGDGFSVRLARVAE